MKKATGQKNGYAMLYRIRAFAREYPTRMLAIITVLLLAGPLLWLIARVIAHVVFIRAYGLEAALSSPLERWMRICDHLLPICAYVAGVTGLIAAYRIHKRLP
ncbi:MAG: hypothetical protein HY296_04895 [Thaumarchaeota archaeon]|nr:hypothetical protein [Nitrososphaerota archaeon]